MPKIITSVEGKRGCGYRQPGGTYLFSEPKFLQPCGKMPIPVDKCPCCGAGIKPARGWTWVDADALVVPIVCKDPNCANRACAFNKPLGMAGLLWIGPRYYTPESWIAEAKKMGASRRVAAVPNNFKLGETWVLVAHRDVIQKPCDRGDQCGLKQDKKKCGGCKSRGHNFLAAIFYAYRPSRIDYIVKGDETKEELENLAKRGITLVKVVKKKEDK